MTAGTGRRDRSVVMRAWIDALRLRSLPLAVAGSIIAAGIAALHDKFSLPVFVLMLLTAVLLQVISNFADEYGDLSTGLDDETRVGPIRGMQRGDITKKEMKLALIITSVLTVVVGIALLIVGLGVDKLWLAGVLLVIGLASLAAAMLYTMGSHPYGYIGLGDPMSFIFFGIVAVAGGATIYLGHFDPLTLIPGFALGFPVVGVLNLNNMRDAEDDRSKGKLTMANALGDPGMRMYHTVILVLAMILFVLYPMLEGIRDPVAYVFVVGFVAYILHIRAVWRVDEPVGFDPLMKPLSLATVVLSIVYALCLALA